MRSEKGKGNNSLLFWRKPNSTLNSRAHAQFLISNF